MGVKEWEGCLLEGGGIFSTTYDTFQYTFLRGVDNF